MKPSPESSFPSVHRVSAFIFNEIWPRLIKAAIPEASPIERLQSFMCGIAVCDYIIFPEGQSERSIQDVKAAFCKDLDTSLWIAYEAVAELEKQFSRSKVKILAEKSDAKRADLWISIVSRVDRRPSGDYWDSKKFQKYFEAVCNLKLFSENDVDRFRDALKNKKRAIRKAEERHWKQFEELIIDCAVQAETFEKGKAAAAKLRKSLSGDRERIGEYLVKILRAYLRNSSGSR